MKMIIYYLLNWIIMVLNGFVKLMISEKLYVVTVAFLFGVPSVFAQSGRDGGITNIPDPLKTPGVIEYEDDYKTGDVNGDEVVDISDIVAIINVISKNDNSNQRADVNEDGSVDISDVVKVINIIAGTDKDRLGLSK